MARSDLLIALVKAGSSGDQALFRKTVEALIAEERSKRHEVLASRLADELGRNGAGLHRSGTLTNGSPQELFFELVPKRALDDLILPADVAAACRELVVEHQRSELLRSYGLQPRHRILLAGSPGNGKTSLAEALANALTFPLIVARYEGLIASYLGETASRLRRLFDYVRTRQCVLFFDEFDTIGKERGDEHETGEIKRVVSSLLLQIDDLPQHVVVVTATNHPELLDRAAWRRFQLRLELPPPTKAQIEAYFERFTKGLEFSRGLSPRTLAEKLAGTSYAELEEFIADVARQYVLSLPEADAKRIVNQRLAQWRSRFNPKK
ncbi:MAG TPA: ATP-binding protein [Pirellulales bacterium]|nr:ATP-binding protein [Pirellulales bacterium]